MFTTVNHKIRVFQMDLFQQKEFSLGFFDVNYVTLCYEWNVSLFSFKFF